MKVTDDRINSIVSNECERVSCISSEKETKEILREVKCSEVQRVVMGIKYKTSGNNKVVEAIKPKQILAPL